MVNSVIFRYIFNYLLFYKFLYYIVKMDKNVLNVKKVGNQMNILYSVNVKKGINQQMGDVRNVINIWVIVSKCALKIHKKIIII